MKEVSEGKAKWIFVKEYEFFNLWINHIGIRECFFKYEDPNHGLIINHDQEQSK